MSDQPTPDRDFDHMEREVVYLLTEPGQPSVWKIKDLGRALDYFDPASLVMPLVRARLLHLLGKKFVVATPAAYKLVGLTGQAV